MGVELAAEVGVGLAVVLRVGLGSRGVGGTNNIDERSVI